MEKRTRKAGRRVDVTSPEGKAPEKADRVKMVETPIFIPYTLESKMRKRLQEIDDSLGEATNSPAIRFVERCRGGTLVELLTSSNPWAKDWCCERLECLPCKSRLLLSGEEEIRPLPQPGEVPRPKPSREETRSYPKCTNEGVGYLLECWTCRLKGKAARYVGESSRSAFQRGKEH